MPKAASSKQKKEKDPDAPKRPLGAYMFFCKEMRVDIKNEHPDWGVTQIGKRLGELWKASDEAKKKKFYDLAEKDKLRYTKDMERYRS